MSKNAGGRPTKYKDEYVVMARKLCELGATDDDVAEALGVHAATINRWKTEHPAFCESLKVGKDAADDRVEMALYRKAVGYQHEAVKIFQFQGQELVVPYTEIQHPDTTAAIFWLKNRRREQYRANPELDPDSNESQSLNITFQVSDPKKEVRVTKGSNDEA